MTDLKYIFLWDNGIEPIKIHEGMNTDFKVEDYLNIHKKWHEVEKISPEVLEDAMIVKSDLNDFNNIINWIREKSESEEMNDFDIKK